MAILLNIVFLLKELAVESTKEMKRSGKQQQCSRSPDAETTTLVWTYQMSR